MEFRILTALIVFAGSYFPLSVILLAQNFQYQSLRHSFCWPLEADRCGLPLTSPMFSIVMLLVTLLCFAITILALWLVRPTQEINVVEARYIPIELMNYTLPYIVSFMSIEYQVTGKFVGFVVFLGWMFWITFRSGQIILNPILIALGWRLYEMRYRYAGSPDIFATRALVKGHLSPGDFKQWPLQDIQIIKPGA